MAQLAIKGCKFRSDEIIEILKMLGGINTLGYEGNSEILYYYIDNDGNIECDTHDEIHSHIRIFTLEEFLARYPYKVGDKVKVCGDNLGVIVSMRWENDHVVYRVKLSKNDYETSKTAGDLQPYKEEKETMEEITIDIPKGYEFAGVDDDNQQVVFTKIGYHYPKTYEECCEILDILGNINIEGYKKELLLSLQKLLICRDAYWKLAGDWQPDCMYCDLYCIGYDGNVITWKMQGGCRLLAFPTAEIRDAFYENFKELIEQCKELL